MGVTFLLGHPVRSYLLCILLTDVIIVLFIGLGYIFIRLILIIIQLKFSFVLFLFARGQHCSMRLTDQLRRQTVYTHADTQRHSSSPNCCVSACKRVYCPRPEIPDKKLISGWDRKMLPLEPRHNATLSFPYRWCSPNLVFVSSYLKLNNRDLEIRVHSMVLFESLGAVSYSPSTVICIISEIKRGIG